MAKATAKGAAFAVTEEIANALLDGDDSYGIYQAFQYYYNLFAATKYDSPVAYKICHVLEDNLGLFDNFELGGKKFPVKKAKAKEKLSYPEISNPGRDKVLKEDWDHIQSYFKFRVEAFAQPVEKTTVFKNIDLYAEALFLNQTEHQILTFLHIAQNDEFIGDISKAVIDGNIGRQVPLFSRFFGMPDRVGDIAKALEFKSPLISNGIIVPHDFENGEIFPEINLSIQEMLPLLNLDLEEIIENMLGKPAEAKLSTDNFLNLAKPLEKIKKIIANAVERGETGVNILFYGPAGSGKTELSKALASELGLTLFAIGEESENGHDYEDTKKETAQHRIAKLLQAHTFLKDHKNAILLFDEIEDLLNKGTDSDKNADTFSKIIVNRLLENNPVVTLWAGNHPDKFPENFRQRFSYALRVDYPPVPMRAQIWDTQLKAHQVTLPEENVRSLARRYQAPARMVANAIRMASLSDMTMANIEDNLRSSSLITYGHADEIESQGGVSDRFRRTLFNYDAGKHNYVSAILEQGSKPTPYSVFMAGMPGTGLKSFGRYLAERGSMNPIEVDMRQLATASPMSSPVANIRNAFAVAADYNALLVVSHLDALCENPESGAGKWDTDLSYLFAEMVSQHDLPVAVTSYKPELEIPGFLKDVFSLDLRISPLTSEQNIQAYERYFGKSPTEEVVFPQGLVPGDFARVSHVLKKDLNGGPVPAKISAMLRQQVSYRQEQGSRLGF